MLLLAAGTGAATQVLPLHPSDQTLSTLQEIAATQAFEERINQYGPGTGRCRHGASGVQNLLLNSAHAMQGKGRNRVAVERSGATCQIAFVDAGPGIPPDLRDKIFTLFFTTKTRGAGLGQPTVKRLVEAHNGQIAIDCPPTGGTTVVIRLPMGTQTIAPTGR